MTESNPNTGARGLVDALAEPAQRESAFRGLLAHGAAPGIVPLLLERGLEDHSLRVRRGAVSLLAWRLAHPDLEGFFEKLVESERDEKLVRHARAGARLCRARAGREGAEASSC